MRWSTLFIPTLRQAPADAEVPSHKLLVRAGFIRQLAAGIYSILPLGRRSLLKIETIIREEMEAIGSREFYLPALHPAEIWQQSGRWDDMGEIMFKLQDRSGRDLALGVTHEEVFTVIARDDLRSYRDLPQIWFQIQAKFRDEPRPKSGLLRVRQFTMKDSYSFDIDREGLDKSYALHDAAYRRIFGRAGLNYLVVEADSGAMGGSESQEFMVFSDAGEDWVVTCDGCDYASNLERAVAAAGKASDPSGEEPSSQEQPEEVHTPGRKTIAEVSEFLDQPGDRQIKSLVYIIDSRLHLVLTRGDHQLNETKLARAVGSELLRPAEPAEIRDHFGADPGSLGPVGLEDTPIVADAALEGRRDMICGANRDDYHLLHVTPGKDFEATFAELRQVEAGDSCARCGGVLDVRKAIEVGHIFKLGTKYSESMKATVLDADGREVPIVMGSYGIGVERILAAAAELFHDDSGLIWPRSIAPFEVIISLLRPDDEQQRETAEQLYSDLQGRGVQCLLDDRDERPGVKFKDAELIGVPLRVTIGKKIVDGEVEVMTRRDRNNRAVAIESAAEEVVRLLDES